MKRKHVKYEEDDGGTIVNMNVDGMPWYRSGKSESGEPQKDQYGRPQISLHSPEGRAALRGAAFAALLVVVLFVGGAFLFILFCEKVWLK